MENKLCKALVTLLCLPLVFTGCKANIVPVDISSDKDLATVESSSDKDNTADPLNNIQIRDNKGNVLSGIQASDVGMLTPKGVFYLKGNEYHLLRTDEENKEDVLLAKYDDLSYETSYSRTFLEGKLYTLAVTGNITGSDPFTLWLLEFDLNEGKAERYKISDNGFPYSSLTSFNGKIIIFFHDQKETLTDRIVEFDPKTGKTSEIMTYDLDKDLNGESARSLCSENDRLYILKLKFKGSSDISMYVDVFDSTYKKISELDVTETVKEGMADCIYTSEASQLMNEMSQHVSAFRVIDGRYLYYQNFSVVRCITDLENGKCLYGIPEPFTSAPGDGDLIFCSINSYVVNDTIDPYAVYRFEDGTLKKDPAASAEDGRIVVSITSSSDGRYMVIYADKNGSVFTANIFP